MRPLYTFLLISILFAIAGCNNHTKTSFAIRDFNKTLQPYLVTVVSKGIVGYDTATSYICRHTTDEEIKQLSQSEFPVLRAVAFREMLDRPTFDHYNLMMSNLDDTAIVATNAGEWGIRFMRVSDDMLQHGKWKDTVTKKKTINEIILKHNYLSAAYYKILDVKSERVYYPIIKKMYQSERSFCDDFEEIEYALCALAAYRKTEDIPAIKELILSNSWRISELSFGLMKDYPDETYLEIYEKYYPRTYYRKLCKDQDINSAISFIKSVAGYKNERSERILDSILTRKLFVPCAVDTYYLKRELVYAIWNNPCIAYSKIRNQVESAVKRYKEQDKKNTMEFELPPLEVDSSLVSKKIIKEPIDWW
jgi:hypothetical protein